MKTHFLFLFLLVIACNKEQNLTPEHIINSSIKKHDPNNNFENLDFKIRVQEPRLQNFVRFSNVSLNNKTGAFILERNRESPISKHIIDSNGKATTFLDDKIITDSILIQKFRLDPKRNSGYRRYYQFFSLLPVSLKNENYTILENVDKVDFNNQKAYKISIELENSFFSKHWNLFFDIINFKFLGLEILFPEDVTKGERIIFDGEIKIDDVQIARYHHWLELDNTYSGSDIIIKEVK